MQDILLLIDVAVILFQVRMILADQLLDCSQTMMGLIIVQSLLCDLKRFGDELCVAAFTGS